MVVKRDLCCNPFFKKIVRSKAKASPFFFIHFTAATTTINWLNGKEKKKKKKSISVPAAYYSHFDIRHSVSMEDFSLSNSVVQLRLGWWRRRTMMMFASSSPAREKRGSRPGMICCLERKGIAKKYFNSLSSPPRSVVKRI